MMAEVTKEYVVVRRHEVHPDGVHCLILSCENGYDTYKHLPDVLRYEERLYGKTGWNSDSLVAYYKTDVKLAEVVKE